MKIEINDLEEVRGHIDRLDYALIYMIAERLNFMEGIADYKARNDLPITDEGREEKIIEELRDIASSEGLNEDFIEEIFLSIINESKRIMHEHLEEKGDYPPEE